jgi:uncharacterized protein (TIGR03083 family)
VDAPALYDASRRRLSELLRSLSPEQLESVVPGCPEWTVRQLVGHLVGAPNDIFAGRFGDLPGDEWTGRQVTERAHLSLEELLTTWEQETPQWMERMAGDDRFRPILVLDAFTHEHDVRGAVGAPPADDDVAVDTVDFVVQQMTGWLDQSLRADESRPALRVRAAEHEWVVGTGEPAATVTLPSLFELARALAGRRSRKQLEDYEWEGDRSKLLDAIPQLPMAAEDQPL